MILSYNIDPAGFHRYVWQQPSGAVLHLKFKAAQDDTALGAAADRLEQAQQYGEEKPLFSEDAGRVDIVRALVALIDERPTITAAQFNSHLNGLQWFEAVETRYLVYLIAARLADRGEVQLSDYTEAQAFVAVRNFIRTTPKRRLARLFINQFDL